MPIIIDTDILMTRKEVAEALQVSYDTIADRAGGTECLMEFRQTKKVQFNPRQVLRHRENVWNKGRCDGSCRDVLAKKSKVK